MTILPGHPTGNQSGHKTSCGYGNSDSDQTAHMHRLIRVHMHRQIRIFAGQMCHFVSFAESRLYLLNS